MGQHAPGCRPDYMENSRDADHTPLETYGTTLCWFSYYLLFFP